MKAHKLQSQSLEKRDSNDEKWSPSPATCVDQRWTQFKISSKNIVSRSHHVSVIYKGKLYVHGGYNTERGVLSDFQQLNLESAETFKWQGLTFNDQNYPGKLRNHSAVVYKDRLVIFGGQNGENRSNNLLWVYDFAQAKWSRVEPNINVPNLDSHAAVSEGSKMYIFGGFKDEQAAYSNILYAVDLQSFKWELVYDPKGIKQKHPSPRASMSMVHYKGGLWVFGGIDMNSTFNDFWRFDLEKRQWSEVTSKNTPEPRRSHSMIVYEDCFWMFGGIQDVTKEKNDINIYTPSSGQWARIMNTSNLVYECSPTMKNKTRGIVKQKSSPKRETKQSNVITLISATNEKSTENNNKPNEGMKRILEENKHKKFLERKHELLKQFTDQPAQGGKRQLSPISESMMKTLELIGEQQPTRKILHGEIIYDPSNKFIIGKKPCARDAHTCLLYNHKMLIFGGDRHLMCFSDLYYFDLKKGIESKTLYQRENVVLKKL